MKLVFNQTLANNGDKLKLTVINRAELDEQLFQWEHIDQIAQRVKTRLRPLLRNIDFQATSANQSLMTAVRFLKTAV